MIVAIDTNRYRDLRDDLPEVAQLIERATNVYVPFVVIAELKIGFGLGKRRRENERQLAEFLRQPGIEVAFPDATTVEVYSTLFLDLKTRGRPLPLNDVWIAALCVQHGWTLYSRDKHFDHLPQVVRV
jgi:tRNA(fMet)-specific endonuclease VapC